MIINHFTNSGTVTPSDKPVFGLWEKTRGPGKSNEKQRDQRSFYYIKIWRNYTNANFLLLGKTIYVVTFRYNPKI